MCCDSKEEYLEFWGYKLGTPEAESAWEAKTAMMDGQKFVESPLVSIFREGLYEHIADKPLYIKSKKQLRDECRSRGLTSDYAE